MFWPVDPDGSPEIKLPAAVLRDAHPAPPPIASQGALTCAEQNNR